MLIAALLLSGCESMPTKEDVKAGVSKVGSSVKGGIGKLKTKVPGRSKEQSTIDVQAIVSLYPLDEAPHTLMKKPVADGKLTSGHGYRFSPTGVPIPRKHKGVDYSAPTGTPVYAAGDGTVVKHYVSESYGNYIRIEHENNFFTAYAHMDAFADGLGVGSAVTRGQIIGNVGSTGRSTGPHLHYELIHGNQFIDPLFVSVPPEAPTLAEELEKEVETAAN